MADKKICVNCNTEIMVEEKFCHKCGYSFVTEGKSEKSEDVIAEEPKKIEKTSISNKKKAIIGVIVAVFACIVGYIGYTSYTKQQIQNYLTEAYTYMTEINDTTQNLYYVNEVWDIAEAGSWMNYAIVKEYGSNMFSEYIMNAEISFKTIEDLYKSLQEKKGSIKKMEKIDEQIEELHLAYETAYSMIILFEYGGNSAEISKLRTETSELKTMINDMANEYGIVVGREDGVKVAN